MLPCQHHFCFVATGLYTDISFQLIILLNLSVVASSGEAPQSRLLQATCPGQSQEDPCEDTSSLLFMCLQNSCSCYRKCLAPAQQARQQARGLVDVPAFPVRDFSQRKDTFYGRSIPSVGLFHLSTGHRIGGKPTETGSGGS